MIQEINSKENYVIIWLSHSDMNDAGTMERVSEITDESVKNKLFVCVFQSGHEDLVENTKLLLRNNI